ncbi:PREDICTED: uncharacterized protein LOC104611440 isoform X3 [Nelumbo nucifera]|uniref:Uncharacterized protein LOC104611440 isoform X3 n=1 Tax=Nelumbo nucifera TaxID=4432 RepID=A0A1U8BIE8_NELNU|nr:PREDICTED: uncharacterized protein LOC104611440 isoform X3 [Nelumbo nucifera]
MTREKEDISWKHCTAVLYGNRGKHESVLKCNYCGATYVAYGGVHRIKRHLAKMGKNAKHCPNVPPEVADLIKRDLAENAQKKRQQQSTGSEHIQITDNYNSTKNQRKDGRKKEQFEIQDRTEELLKCQPTQSVQGAKEGSQFQGASSDVVQAMMDEEIPPSNTVMEVEAHPEPEQETIDGILKRLRNIEAQLQQLQHLQALESKVQKLKQLISTQLMEYKSEMLQGFTSLSLQIQRSSAMPEANMAHTQEANNFQVMNCVMDVLVHEQLANGLVKRHYFPSYFAEKILKDEPPSLEELKAFYQSLLKYDLLQCELLFIPLCVDSHWFVYVINLRDKRVEVLNSLPMDGFTIELKYLLRMKETCNDILSSLSGRPMAITEWPVLLPELPIQKSDCDCGIFVICYMEYWDGRLMKSFAQDDIPYFRMKVLADLLLHPENKVVIRDG